MAHNYTGNPSAVEAPSAAPAPGVAPIISIPDGTDAPTIESITQQMKVGADFLAALFATYYAPGCFGSGADGALTFDGVAAVLGLAPVAGVYTMNRDIFGTTILVTGAGTVVITNGFRIYASVSLTTAAGGKISNGYNGGASSTSGGAAGTLGAGGNGGAGAANGTSVTISLGGAGGNSSSNTGGTVTAPSANLGSVNAYSPHAFGSVSGNNGGSGQVQYITGGGGGAGVGGADGGGAGGVMAIASRSVTLSNASDLIVAGNPGKVGASGGGGGGAILLAYGYITISAGALSAATNCPGGAAGGAGGFAGSNGQIIAMQVK